MYYVYLLRCIDLVPTVTLLDPVSPVTLNLNKHLSFTKILKFSMLTHVFGVVRETCELLGVTRRAYLLL